MRIFAALPLPLNLKIEIGEKQKELKDIYKNLKYVNPENMHLTLYFFGEIDESKTEEIFDIMDDPSMRSDRIKCSIDEAGFFPDSGMVRVVYLGIKNGKNEIVAYQKNFVELLARRGFAIADKPFNTHITVARNKREKIKKELVKEKLHLQSAFTIDRIVLYRSILHRDGPRYIPLKTVMFKR